MHILKTQSFDRNFLAKIFEETKKLRLLKRTNQLKNKIVATLFYEPSTRTRLSFESAALRLGASIISTESAKEFSSAAKGEILEDTIRVLDGYCDCIVLRHHEKGAAQRAAHVSSVPIINAGDGSGQHPTQSLLDLFTIDDELGSINGIHVGVCGDLKHGRTVHSLAYLLGKFKKVHIYLISPESLIMPQDILNYLDRHNIEYTHHTKLIHVINQLDVLYQTRIQRERFDASNIEDLSDFVINRKLANMMREDAIILHPLPRIDEIRYSVDDNHRAKYFKQAENGVYVRMALLRMLLGEEEHGHI